MGYNTLLQMQYVVIKMSFLELHRWTFLGLRNKFFYSILFVVKRFLFCRVLNSPGYILLLL